MLKKIFIVFILLIITLSADASKIGTKTSCTATWEKITRNYDLEPLYKSLIGTCGVEFRKRLLKKIATNRELDYKDARYIMFAHLDNVNGSVCGVYSGTCIRTKGIPNHRYYNTEHSWCQSWGAVGIAKSDLHHLFPVKANLNSKRNNFPFCEVSYASWEGYGSAFGKSYSRTSCFEPPQWHKGELARSMFYFAVRYSKRIDSEQEKFFRKWNKENSVSDKEHYRNIDIEKYQGNKNPFVLYPEFADLIYDF